MRPLLLGTRRSALALAQSQAVADRLMAAHPGLRVELVPIVTEGDRRPGDLSAVGGKGLFTREIEMGLADGSLDLAVHSLKDLPVGLPEGLKVAAYPPREDPRDVLVSEVAGSVAELATGAVVLTGSLRRRGQLLAARRDLEVRPLRGNVETRLAKWRHAGAAATVLAAAGLGRLGLADVPGSPLDPAVLVPAPGQGTLAVEVRAGGRAEALMAILDDAPTRRAAAAERAVVRAFGGDCTLPLAAWAREEEGRLRLDVWLGTADGTRHARASRAGENAEDLAGAVVAELEQQGAAEILALLGRERPR